MRIFNFKSRYKRFHFYTRFYDENKERIELKRKQYQDLENASEEERKLIFKEQLRESWSNGKQRTTNNLYFNLRIISLIGIILLLGYFIFNGVDSIENVIFKVMEE